MGLEDEPPPLPPRNYDWSDVEDNDEDLFQSEDELEEPSCRISLDEQQAMYSSVSLTLSLSAPALAVLHSRKHLRKKACKLVERVNIKRKCSHILFSNMSKFTSFS